MRDKINTRQRGSEGAYWLALLGTAAMLWGVTGTAVQAGETTRVSVDFRRCAEQ